jgi:hypothetical protein
VKIKVGNQELEVLVGADPEFFVGKGGKPLSAFGLVPGDKNTPYKVDKGAVQVDGMALEFNIDPAANEAEFLTNLDGVMTTLLHMVPDYEYIDSPVADFGLEYIAEQPEVAKILGCEPDYNAYTLEANPRPDAKRPFRTASGHVHVGWTKDVDPQDPGHMSACARLARMLDYTLGVPSLIWDEDDRRRELYGQPGAFRPKHYGMEYRVLSNAWLNPVENPGPQQPGKFLRRFVYAQTIKAFQMLADDPANDTKMINGRTAKDIITSGDRKAAFYAIKYGRDIPAPSSFRVNAPAAVNTECFVDLSKVPEAAFEAAF